VAVAVVALTLVMAGLYSFAMIGLTATGSSERTAEPGYEYYPTQSYTPVPLTTYPTATTRQSTSPTTPTTADTTDPWDTPEQRSHPSQPQPVYLLENNPIHQDGLGVPAVTCHLPPWDWAQQQVYYEAAVQCMRQAWDPVLSAAGLPTGAPRVFTPTGEHSTPCGNQPATASAYYCRGNIYMPPRYFTEVEGQPTNRPAIYLEVLAHEYGHHVQQLSGIMTAAWDARYEVGPNSEAGLLISRRLELQASCFGGMFFAATVGNGLDRSLYEQALLDASNRGDQPGGPRDHGSPRNNGAWFQQGAQKNRTYQCNTWLIEASAVS